jgi:5-hydroxyisourate hydrolase-like protein (transthyretin family)
MCWIRIWADPRPGLIIELWNVSGEPVKLKTTMTNSDGRVDEPLLQGNASEVGNLRIALPGRRISA